MLIGYLFVFYIFSWWKNRRVGSQSCQSGNKNRPHNIG